MNHFRSLLALLPVLVLSITSPSAPLPQGKKDPPKEPQPKAGSIFGRTNPQWVEKALRQDGGTKDSEAAVVRGLRWLKRNQLPNGSWKLDGNFNDRGQPNDTAATAFGLLPFLGAGKTHKVQKDNPYHQIVDKGLQFLIGEQDGQTGNLGGGMYAHALATIVLAEAYGLTQDRKLREPAQLAVNYIVKAQHGQGGWRYAPVQAGDLSVTGWQVMALLTGRMAGLDVPVVTFRKANIFLKSCWNNANEGYGYIGPDNPTPTMSAVGLLLRQYLNGWGPKEARLLKGIDNHLVPNPPGASKNMYYYYYATQVMHHLGGERWQGWNLRMRHLLVKTQNKTKGPNSGSWSSEGDAHGPAGGRLMITSLSLLTLEVYYRHVPLHRRVLDSKK
jgi:hypothetical protein